LDPTDLIIKERHGEHVLVMTVNRFARRNAFDRATALALEAALDEFEADDSLFVGVLTGAGGVFSAGQDLLTAKEGELAIAPHRGGFGIMAKPPAKPLIAAVEGYALAGGLELALSCDLIVSSSEATMGLPEATWSLVAAGAGLFRLPQRIPYHIAMELALTWRRSPGDRVSPLGAGQPAGRPGRGAHGRPRAGRRGPALRSAVGRGLGPDRPAGVRLDRGGGVGAAAAVRRHGRGLEGHGRGAVGLRREACSRLARTMRTTRFRTGGMH